MILKSLDYPTPIEILIHEVITYRKQFSFEMREVREVLKEFSFSSTPEEILNYRVRINRRYRQEEKFHNDSKLSTKIKNAWSFSNHHWKFDSKSKS